MSNLTRAQQLTALFNTDRPVALVTGSGAPRVGQVIARRLVETGYQVVLHAHRSLDDVRALSEKWRSEGHSVSYVTGAIDSQSNIDAWCQQIGEQHGGLHVLVNSAAAWDPTPLETLDEAKLLEQWRVNLMAPTLLCRAAGLMMASGSHGGALVNIGDWAGIRPYPDFASYLLSKGAIETLTHVMAVELASRHSGIRVNAVLPGPVLLDSRIGQADRQRIVEQSLLKREGTPEDVASAVQFLIESPFITGVCLPVDGGRTIYAGPSADIASHPTYNPSN